MYTVVRPLSCTQKVHKRPNLYLQGEDCESTMKKKVHTVPSSIIKFSRKIGRNISVQKNYANELLFSLNVR